MALFSLTLSASTTYKLFGLSVFDSLDREPLNLTISQPLTEALEVASEFVGESIPILEGEKLRGAINEGDLFKKILDIEDSLRSDQSSNT